MDAFESGKSSSTKADEPTESANSELLPHRTGKRPRVAEQQEENPAPLLPLANRGRVIVLALPAVGNGEFNLLIKEKMLMRNELGR